MTDMKIGIRLKQLNHPLSKFSILLQFLAGISMHQVDYFGIFLGLKEKAVIINITSSLQGIFRNNIESSKPAL